MTLATSIDGYIADRDGGVDWLQLVFEHVATEVLLEQMVKTKYRRRR